MAILIKFRPLSGVKQLFLPAIAMYCWDAVIIETVNGRLKCNIELTSTPGGGFLVTYYWGRERQLNNEW